MSVKLCHKALAERHHFPVGFSFRIKVTAALAAADGQPCQGVLKYLLKTEELDDAEVYGRMESESSLVGPDRAVKLYTEAVVHLYLSLVVHPGHTEHNDPLRCRQPL